MKFAEKIKELNKDKKFQYNRRMLKAMTYIANHDKNTFLTLEPWLNKEFKVKLEDKKDGNLIY